MHNGFTDLRDIAALDRLLAQPGDVPVVIFKHSETCGISARAHTEMLKLAATAHASDESPIANLQIGIVAIQTAREVSNEIEARTGVEHESPQVFVMRKGQVTWSASHGAVKAEAVQRAVLQAVSSGE